MGLIDANELYRVKFHGYSDIEITPSDVNAEAYKRGWNDAIDAVAECGPFVEIVRCRDCKHCFVDGENGRHKWLYNCCELNHNKLQRDNWFCADGERREDNG